MDKCILMEIIEYRMGLSGLIFKGEWLEFFEYSIVLYV